MPFYWIPIVLACLTVSVAQLGVGLLLPALPAISQDLSLDPAQAQWYISIYLLGFAISQLVYGPLSDAWGRRPILLIGLCITLMGVVLCMFGQQSAELILAGRLLQGAGAGSASVLGRAMIRDRYDGKQLSIAISYVGIAAAMTPMLAPFAGGYLSHHFGWSALFIVMAFYICLIWFVMFFCFAETRTGNRLSVGLNSILNGYGDLLRDRYFLGYAGLNTLFFCLHLLLISVMPYLLQKEIGMDASDYGQWSLIPAACGMFGSFLSNKLRHHLNDQQRLNLSYLLLGCSALFFILVPLELYWLVASQSLFAMAFGIGFMMSLTCLLSPYKKNSGSVSALAGCLQMLLGSLATVVLVDQGVTTPLTLGVTMTIGVVLCLLLNRLAGGSARAKYLLMAECR